MYLSEIINGELVSPRNEVEGRLEVKVGKVWGTICKEQVACERRSRRGRCYDDVEVQSKLEDELQQNQLNVARVACRAMGLSGGEYRMDMTPSVYSQPGGRSNESIPVHMMKVRCNGTEESLDKCS